MFEAPTITSLSESTGSGAGGTIVGVTGSGFAKGIATTFKFGKGSATAVDCTSTTDCTMRSPAAAKGGTVDVRATVSGKRSRKNPADQFTYG